MRLRSLFAKTKSKADLKSKTTKSKSDLADSIAAFNAATAAATETENSKTTHARLAAPPSKFSMMLRFFSYLGLLFFLAGTIVYFGIFWGSMSSFSKIVLILGPGIILYLLTLGLDRFYRRAEPLLNSLYIVSATLQTGGLFVAINEFKLGIPFSLACVLIFGIMLIQQAFAFWTIKRLILIYTSLFFAGCFILANFEMLGINQKIGEMTASIMLLGTAYFLNKAQLKWTANFWYIAGTVLLLNGLFDTVKYSYLEILFIGVNCSMIYLSHLLRIKAVKYVSIVSLLVYIGYFTDHYLSDSDDWPIILVLLGALFFGISMMLLKMRRIAK